MHLCLKCTFNKTCSYSDQMTLYSAIDHKTASFTFQTTIYSTYYYLFYSELLNRNSGMVECSSIP